MEEMKSTNNEDNYIEWGGWLNEFFWLCAGVNRKVLRQCPTDYAKYAGIGGTILFTALMAMLSGGYAMFFVFKSQFLAISFGIFWGLLIFNFDRFIVNTMYSDGKVTISWREFYSGLPRIIIAIFLGIVISTPLELKIYEKSINIEIKSMKENKLKELLADDESKLEELNVKKDEIQQRDIVNASIGSAGNAYTAANNELASLQAQYDQHQFKINNLLTRRRHLSQVTDSVEYRKISNSIYQETLKRNALRPRMIELQTLKANEDDTYREAVKVAETRRQKDLESINSDIDNLKNKINAAEVVYESQLSDEFDGFQGRMEAFHNLQYDKRLNGEKTPVLLMWLMDEDERINSTWWAALFISLLFIIIETAPTFFKMMIASGPYDDLLRFEMHRVRVLSDKRISDINDDINTEIQITTQKNKNRLEAELLANKKLLERLANAQAELLQTAIDKWREEELKKINEDPSAYIKTNSVS